MFKHLHVFETPQAAWSRMTRALAAGNVDDAMESLSPDVRENYRRQLKSMDSVALQRLGTRLGTLASVTYIGDPGTAEIAYGRLGTPEKRGREVLFSHVSGRWYIGQF